MIFFACWLGMGARTFAAEVPPEPVVEEVVVYADHRVVIAKDRIIQSLRAHGFTQRIERDDVTILRHGSPWRGEVHLHDDGRFDLRRQPVRVEGREMPWASRNSAGAWAGCLLWPYLCVRPAGQLYSRRRHQGGQDQTMGVLDDNVEEWQEALADRAHGEQLEALPERLQSLWDEGIALGSDGHLSTYPERRDALYDYWASRTETRWGEDVRALVVGFVRSVVQDSPHPFPAEESAWLEVKGDAP